MCHAILQDIKFFQLLHRIDHELAQQTRAAGCPCGAVLHRANYPRKPRGCPIEVRTDFESRLSFCCSDCRKRSTSMSVRFLGRRVYVGLIVVLMSQRPFKPTAAATGLSQVLEVPIRTLQRWRQWWRETFPTTSFWQATCARFMPPVVTDALPASLMARFGECTAEPLTRLLDFLTPITVTSLFTLQKAR